MNHYVTIITLSMLLQVLALLSCLQGSHALNQALYDPVRNTLDGLQRNPVSGWCNCRHCAMHDAGRDPTNVAYNRTYYENVAYSKVVFGSPRLLTRDQTCAVTNGLWLNWDTSPKTVICYEPDPAAYLPWVEVNLGQVFTIYHFTLIRRDSPGKDDYRHMVEVEVRVDGWKCYTFPKLTGSNWDDIEDKVKDLPQVMNLTCQSPRTGRYVRVFKTGKDELFAKEGIRLNSLLICELQIWICKPKTYGSIDGTCKPCPEYCERSCDNYFGCVTGTRAGLYDVVLKKRSYTASKGTGNEMSVNNGQTFDWSPARCFLMTHSTKLLYWKAKLRNVYKMISVYIMPLISDGVAALKDFRVEATLEADGRSDVTTLCYEHQGQLTETRFKSYLCQEGPVLGTWVGIYSTRQLGFCELKVMGYRMYYSRALKPCDDKRENMLCVRNTVCEKGTCKITLLQACQAEGECVADSVCDFNQYGGTCKQDTGKACRTVEECQRGDFCEVDTHICKRKLGCSCEGDEHCPTNAVCGALKTCGLKTGDTCTASSECTSGAACVSGQCSCTQDATATSNQQCAPKPTYIASPCTNNGSCSVDRSSCDASSQCVCAQDMEVFAEDYTCRYRAGTECSSDAQCNTGLVCEGGACKLTAGMSCLHNTEHCTAEVVCDEDQYCRAPEVAVGGDCSSQPDKCQSGSTCHGGTCKIMNGDDCSGKTEFCISGYCSPQDNDTCRINVNEGCRANTSRFCRHGTFCEYQEFCKVEQGQSCVSTAQCLEDGQCSARPPNQPLQCRWPLRHGCGSDEDCVTDSVCDVYLKQCRTAKGAACSVDPPLCLSGARCTGDGGQCACIGAITKQNTDNCDANEGVAGGACLSDGTCSTEGSGCEDGTCQCLGTSQSNPSTLSCLLGLGSVCSNSAQCVHGAVCDVRGVCALNVKEYCEGELSAQCMEGALCDSDSTCRLDAHHSCTDAPGDRDNGCRAGLRCDIFHRCKKPHGKRCRKDRDCMAGSSCDHATSTCQCTEGAAQLQGHICVPNNGKVGGQCKADSSCDDPEAACGEPGAGAESSSGNVCQCTERFVGDPVTLTCAKAVGQSCSQSLKAEQCMSDLVCDSSDSICRVPVGERCGGNREEFCVSGSLCDRDSVCRLELYGNCGGIYNVFCQSDLHCDWLGRCSSGAGSSCTYDTNADSGNEACVAGAKCSDHVCLCDHEASFDNGIICEPLPGKFGSSCDLLCDIELSECVDNTCQCSTGAKADRQFNCVMKSVAQKPRTNRRQMLTVVLSLVFGLLSLVLLVLVLWRRRKKNIEKRKQLTRVRAASMHELQRLSRHAQAVVGAEDQHEVSSAYTHSEVTDSTAAAESSVQETSTFATASKEPSASLPHAELWMASTV